MGKIITDGSGNALLSNGRVLEVTASIDSNIVAENIKKNVEILGVTGTYEGGGSVTINFTMDSTGLLYYVTSGGIVDSRSGSGIMTLSCLPKSMFVYFSNSATVPEGDNYMHIMSMILGQSALYRYVTFYQVASAS